MPDDRTDVSTWEARTNDGPGSVLHPALADGDTSVLARGPVEPDGAGAADGGVVGGVGVAVRDGAAHAVARRPASNAVDNARRTNTRPEVRRGREVGIRLRSWSIGAPGGREG